jgi:four helix bundle protein
MRDFRDLLVWQRSHELTLALYRATEGFPRTETFGLTSQIRRAGASIPTNLAEGCGRWGDGDMGRFIQIAMGSASEVAYLSLLARDLGYFGAAEYERLSTDLNDIRRMLTAFYKRVRKTQAEYSASGFAKS